MGLGMQIQTNVSLKDYSTMRIGGIAKALCTVTTKQELEEAVAWAEERKLPLLVLGGGSNVIFSNDYNGLVVVNRIGGFEIFNEDESGAMVRAGAGENWDSVVARTVEKNMHGIEYLSAIPGTVGGTPVQNVGAYGAQISDVFIELEAYDTSAKKFVALGKDECQFTYRNSIFKSPKDRHYIIVSVTLRLTKDVPKPPFYDSLKKYLHEHSVTEFTPQSIRDAVVAIRAVKLPDPTRMANTGSFFKNPIIPAEQGKELLAKNPDIAQWPMPDGRVKVAAGWLVEQAGLKGYKAHGMKTYEHHALVLVNESAKNYDDLAAFRQEIVDKVHSKFGVTLEQEPELL
jgi:UDP-N-acetylmuramate dehydrogenase